MIPDEGDPWVCVFCAKLRDAPTLEDRWNHLLDDHLDELMHAKATVVISRPLSKR